MGEYKKPYLDSSVFIGWVKAEVVEGIERGRIAECILSSAEKGDFFVYTSALTLAEVHKMKHGSALTDDNDKRILDYLERNSVKLIDIDRRVGEKANELCRQYGLSPNDAVHLASALKAGCEVLLAWDRRFTDVSITDISIEEPGIDQGNLFEQT